MPNFLSEPREILATEFMIYEEKSRAFFEFLQQQSQIDN